MNEIIMQSGNSIVQTQALTEDIFTRFTAYIDASEKTVQTYTRAIRQYVKWASYNGISQPTREDILRYKGELKENHKPTTVQNYITALKLFFQCIQISKPSVRCLNFDERTPIGSNRVSILFPFSCQHSAFVAKRPLRNISAGALSTVVRNIPRYYVTHSVTLLFHALTADSTGFVPVLSVFL